MPLSPDAETGHTLHATAVALRGQAVLLRGPSGAGKSDLALRLLDRDWQLVGDDYVVVAGQGGMLTVHALDQQRGMLEVRGIGVQTVPAHRLTDSAIVACVINLVDAREKVERMPEERTVIIHDLALPVVDLFPFDASAPLKVELCLERYDQGGR